MLNVDLVKDAINKYINDGIDVELVTGNTNVFLRRYDPESIEITGTTAKLIDRGNNEQILIALDEVRYLSMNHQDEDGNDVSIVNSSEGGETPTTPESNDTSPTTQNFEDLKALMTEHYTAIKTVLDNIKGNTDNEVSNSTEIKTKVNLMESDTRRRLESITNNTGDNVGFVADIKEDVAAIKTNTTPAEEP